MNTRKAVRGVRERLAEPVDIASLVMARIFFGLFMLKGSLVEQAKRVDSPFSMVDVSLKETYPDGEWLRHAQSAISKCDIVIVLLGEHTHRAAGVLNEVKIATGLRKPIFQLRPQRSDAEPVPNAGLVIKWTWPNLQRAIYGRLDRRP